MADDDRLRELEEKYEGYKVYDNAGEKIGKVDDLFVDESDREEYIGVKMGLFGTKSTLIPMDIVRVNESDRAIEVADSKDHVKDAPNFSDDDDITPDFERSIREHFGLESQESSETRGSYGRSSGSGAGAAAASGGTTGGAQTGSDRGTATTGGEADDDYPELDLEGSSTVSQGGSRQSVGREEYRNREDYGGSGATGTAATGGMSDLETGERGPGGGEAYREAYEEGLREGRRQAAGGGTSAGETSAGGGGGSRGETEAASEYLGDTAGGGTSSGSNVGDRGEAEASREYLGEGGGGGPRRSSDEGGQEESSVTKVWRRIRS